MRLNNTQFAKKDRVFRKACEIINLPPTTRQASKYRAGKGKARTVKTKAFFVSNQEMINSIFERED